MTNDYKSNNRAEDMTVLLNIASFADRKLLMTISLKKHNDDPNFIRDYHWWYPVLDFVRNLTMCAYPGSGPADPIRDTNIRLVADVWPDNTTADRVINQRIVDFVNWYNKVSELPRETKFTVNVMYGSGEVLSCENCVPIMIDFRKEIVDLSNSGIFTYLGEIRDSILDDEIEESDTMVSDYNWDHIQFYELYEVIEELCTAENIGIDTEVIFRNGKRVRLNNTVPDSDTTDITEMPEEEQSSEEVTRDAISFISKRIKSKFGTEEDISPVTKDMEERALRAVNKYVDTMKEKIRYLNDVLNSERVSPEEKVKEINDVLGEENEN